MRPCTSYSGKLAGQYLVDAAVLHFQAVALLLGSALVMATCQGGSAMPTKSVRIFSAQMLLDSTRVEWWQARLMLVI